MLKPNEVQKMNGLEKKEKSSAKKERNVIPNPPSADEGTHKFKIPPHNEVQEYFKSQKYPLIEASKFYNYFQSNGWLVGGRTKMKDWKAAARNWMLNADKFLGGRQIKPKAKQLHATTGKNYSEPL